MYFVYILECADKSLYVGCTNNLEKRVKQHNNAKAGAHYTKIRRPVILKYFEKFKTLARARMREAEIKRQKRIDKLNLINQLMPDLKKKLGKDRIVYHKDGSVWARGNILNGQPDGYWEWFRKDGTKMRSGYFTDGKQDGEWTTYDKRGKVFKVTQINEL